MIKSTNIEREKKESISRSKKTVVRLVDFLAEEGMSKIPSGTRLYKCSKILLKHAVKFFTDSRDIRIKEFHETILEGIDPDKQDNLLNKEFSIADYYSILNHILQDEEDTKIQVYAKIFKGIILGLIPLKYKIHIIKSTRELKFSDFELMRLLYINDKYEFITPGNRINQIKQLTDTNDPIKSYSIQSLIRLGFLLDRDGNKPPWPSELLKILVELLYDEKELKA